MKKFIMALVLMPLMALAGTEKIGDVTWSFTVANGEATVTGANPVSGVLEIPSALGGCPVTSIGENAVYYCTSLTSVTIPEGVTSIGEWAFSHCHGLTSVTIPSSVMSIGNCAFRGCSGLTSVTIPSSVTSIGHSAFRECSKLTEIVVATGNPSYCSVEGILYNKSKSVLIQCPGNKEGSVTIPSSVTSVGDYAFYGCSGLKDADGFVIVKDVLYGYYGAAWSVTIPEGVTSIGYGAFWSCSSMRSVTIPSSVTSIGNYAFYHCYGLVSVTISSSVTSIGSDAFNNCSALKVVYAAKGDAERVAKLYQWASSVEFVEIDPPGVEGDEGATVVGDAETGFVVKPSDGKVVVEVMIPQGVDAAKVTVEVSPKVSSVKPNGAKVKIVSGGADITEFLNVPATDGNGIVDLTKVTVKEEIVKEAMDVEKGAKIVLDAANPSLTTPNTRVGLFYQLREGTTPEGMANGDSTIGDGKPWSPEITVKDGNSAFYSIGVGKGE